MSDKVITIAIFTQNVHALYAKNSLEEADIKVFLSGENTVTDNALRASAIGNIRVQILEADLEKAAPIIEKVRQELEETQENPVELEDETWQREKEEPENVVPISSKDSFARRNLALFAALAVLILWAVWFFKYSGKFNQLSGGIDATFTLELPPNADATCDVNVLVITLEKRLLLYGLARSNMAFKPARQQIEVELKGIDDIERVSNLLTVQGKLEFWETYENREIYGYLVQSNEMLASIVKPQAEPVKAIIKGTKEAADTGTGLSLLDKIKEIDGGAYTVSVTDPNGGKSPLFSILQPAIF
ncbi:MAG: DUF2007 domain-containing protein, partial [Flavobacteriales bacterium]|nr:DUF2007 domain-containing protein [Flavobacteriales bacterium]